MLSEQFDVVDFVAIRHHGGEVLHVDLLGTLKVVMKRPARYGQAIARGGGKRDAGACGSGEALQRSEECGGRKKIAPGGGHYCLVSVGISDFR